MTRYRFPPPRTLILGNVIAVCALILLLPDKMPDWESILAQSLRGAFAIMVVVVYGGALIERWCEQKHGQERSPADLNVMAIFLVFLAEAFAAGHAVWWRWEGKLEDWTTSGWWVLAPMVVVLASLHLVVNPGSIDGRIPKRAMIALGAGVGLTCLLFGLALGLTYQPIMR